MGVVKQMSQLKLIVPGLLGPFTSAIPDYIQQQFKQPVFNELNKWLSRAELTSTSARNYFETLVSEIAPQYESGICQLTATHDEIDLSGGYFYRADPVHFKAESDHAILIGSEFLDPSFDESKQLIDVFNQHFMEDKLSLHASSADRWYLKCESPLELDFSALDYALGRDIKHFMPKGKDELWWRKIVNEAQMLFFQHEVNQQRELKGQSGINGLWLWDLFTEHEIKEVNIIENTKIIADDIVAIALAKQSGFEINAPTGHFENTELTQNNVLVTDMLYMPVCYGDLEAWVDSVANFCQSTLSLISTLLKTKAIDEVYIYPCDGRVFQVDRRQLAKFWKPVKTVDHFVSNVN